MTELKKVTIEIYDEYSKTLSIEEMLMLKTISDKEMKNALIKKGWTKEKCLSSDHQDVDEKWLHDVFNA